MICVRNHLLNLLNLREIMLPGRFSAAPNGAWMGWGSPAQGFRYRSTPAYELIAPNGAPCLAAVVSHRIHRTHRTTKYSRPTNGASRMQRMSLLELC